MLSGDAALLFLAYSGCTGNILSFYPSTSPRSASDPPLTTNDFFFSLTSLLLPKFTISIFLLTPFSPHFFQLALTFFQALFVSYSLYVKIFSNTEDWRHRWDLGHYIFLNFERKNDFIDIDSISFCMPPSCEGTKPTINPTESDLLLTNGQANHSSLHSKTCICQKNIPTHTYLVLILYKNDLIALD